MQLAIGIAFWPVLLLWTSQIGWRWSTVSVRLVVVALAIISVERDARRMRAGRPLSYAFLFGAAIVSRVLQARDLAFPPWVDSVHHAMIARAIIDSGTLPPLYYHWGYHALVAFVSWFTGVTDPMRLPAVMLAFGQLLNALTFVMVYAAARVLFNSRNAGLAAATIATMITTFPAFYLSWGRYTHLTGVLLLPPLLIATWRLVQRPSARGSILLALLGAGLFLIHVRIAFFVAPITALASTILAGPWLFHLLSNPRVAEFASTRLVSMPSVMITLFLPLAIVCGGIIARIGRRSRAITPILAAVAIFGVIAHRDVVAPITILANADDLEAMRWIREHSPERARFAINAAPWMGEAFMGVDGGYWIPVMTGRSSIVPPALYAWTLPAKDVAAINRIIEAWANDRVIEDPTVTHIYSRRPIPNVPSAHLMYAHGGVFIYSVGHLSQGHVPGKPLQAFHGPEVSAAVVADRLQRGGNSGV